MWGLEDWIDLDNIFGSALSLNNESKEKAKSTVINFISEMLENDLFKISDSILDTKIFDTSKNKIEQIKKILSSMHNNVFGILYFELTEKGLQQAKKYCNTIQNLKISILKLAKINFIQQTNILNLIKIDFNTNDLEEISYEFLTIVPYMINHELIKIYILRNNKNFEEIELNDKNFQNLLSDQFNSDNEHIFFKNTTKGNDIIKKYIENVSDLHELSLKYNKEKINGKK